MERRKIQKNLVFSLILFAFLVGSVLYEAFEINFMVLSAVFQLLFDSSTFLTCLCVFLIFCEAVREKKSYTAICVYIVDIMLTNRLYLNTNLLSFGRRIQDFFAEIEWQTVVFYAFLGGIAVWCFRVARREYHESVSNDKRADLKKKEATVENGIQNSRDKSFGEGDAGLTDSVEFGNKDNISETSADLSASSVTNSKQEQQTGNQMQKKWLPGRMQSFFTRLAVVCAGIIGTFLARNLIAEMFEWSPELSKNVEVFFGILPPLVFISSGILISLLVGAIIFSIKRNYASAEVQGTALTAVILEIAIFLWIIQGGDGISSEFFDRFLNTVTSNTLVAIVFIPIILFIFLHIALSIACGFFFKQKTKDFSPWYTEAWEKFQEIEGGLVKFALNLILGFVNFLLFIPDFLNQVCGVLLDKTDFFPKEPSDKQERDSKR